MAERERGSEEGESSGDDQVVPDFVIRDPDYSSSSDDGEGDRGGGDGGGDDDDARPGMDMLRMLMDSGRSRREDISTLDDAVDVLQRSERILVVCGAGISVSCGIPDFRSADGIYARLKREHPELSDPSDMFSIDVFQRDPQIFYNFSKEIYMENFRPSLTHRFISELERRGKLLRDYTQNIDTLEDTAGIRNVVYCHGSYATARCLRCGRTTPGDSLREYIVNQRVPYCEHCPEGPEGERAGVIKPDIVFFGEALPVHFHESLAEDRHTADLVIVMGSSLKVQPVASIPSRVPESVPQLLINRELVGQPHDFDVNLLGNCDAVCAMLAARLGWDLGVPDADADEGAAAAAAAVDDGEAACEHIEPNTYLFEGGERPPPPEEGGGMSVDMLEQLFLRMLMSGGLQ